jgi:hypothetical protein
VDTSHPDPAGVLPFYAGIFGWEFDDATPGTPGPYFMARIRGGDVAAIGAIQGGPPMATWNTYVSVAGVEKSVARVTEAGGSVLVEPFDVMDAGRMAVIADPEGAVLSVWEAKEHQGAQIVNEHGALNFNGLATRDVEGAKAFYGAVFGWELLHLAAGPMWALPGYGDHLEESSPGLREQMASMGAPDGFIDVVAAVEPIAADDPATPAHWSVTFGVDDVAEAAAQATELGGEVVTGPIDVPWSRMAVIKDPQGAVFIASQFVAENSDLTA